MGWGRRQEGFFQKGKRKAAKANRANKKKAVPGFCLTSHKPCGVGRQSAPCRNGNGKQGGACKIAPCKHKGYAKAVQGMGKACHASKKGTYPGFVFCACKGKAYGKTVGGGTLGCKVAYINGQRFIPNIKRGKVAAPEMGVFRKNIACEGNGGRKAENSTVIPFVYKDKRGIDRGKKFCHKSKNAVFRKFYGALHKGRGR